MGNELLNQRARICAEHGIPFNAVVADALERARVVGVLDAWQSADRLSRESALFHTSGHSWCIALVSNSGGTRSYFYGDTPDAARAAAAKAIEAGEV